jgi:uncharacterized phage protein (TIGR01671 family)
MREIKFRAWIKKEKKMCRVNQINFDGFITVRFPEHESEIGDVFDDHMELDEFIALQYTGLKDKNGREIYEGDIVYMSEYGDYPMEVYWHENMVKWFMKNSIGNTDHLYMQKANNYLEIIGNIYENPELIK